MIEEGQDDVKLTDLIKQYPFEEAIQQFLTRVNKMVKLRTEQRIVVPKQKKIKTEQKIHQKLTKLIEGMRTNKGFDFTVLEGHIPPPKLQDYNLQLDQAKK